MSLFDVDKDSIDRGSPMPNHDDKVIEGAHKAHGTVSTNYTSDATSTASNAILLGLGRMVKSGVVSHTVTAGANLNLTTTTVPHGLGYAPIPVAFLNNASINGGGSFNIPLPTWLSATKGLDQSSVPFIIFQAWTQYSADATNFYVQTLNVGNIDAGATVFITYYLYQQVSGTQ